MKILLYNKVYSIYEYVAEMPCGLVLSSSLNECQTNKILAFILIDTFTCSQSVNDSSEQNIKSIAVFNTYMAAKQSGIRKLKRGKFILENCLNSSCVVK